MRDYEVRRAGAKADLHWSQRVGIRGQIDPCRRDSFRQLAPAMCNRFVQTGRVIKPGERAMVLMRGPGGEFELPFDAAVFGGPARSESRGYWIKREGAEPVIVPDIERFGEKDKATGRQNWEDV